MLFTTKFCMNHNVNEINSIDKACGHLINSSELDNITDMNLVFIPWLD